MSLNHQALTSSNLLLQKRDRKSSGSSTNPQNINNNLEREEKDNTKLSSKNLENKSFSISSKHPGQIEVKINQEFNINIIPPTIKAASSRRMSLNSVESRTICNCKNSQCLKLYCECFSTMSYCDPKFCSCKNCINTTENEEIRKNAINNYFLKSPNSFKKVFTSGLYSGSSAASVPNKEISVTRGCTCKKSNCLKKYCECYQSGLACNSHCKCLSCKNTKVSESEENLINSNTEMNFRSNCSVFGASNAKSNEEFENVNKSSINLENVKNKNITNNDDGTEENLDDVKEKLKTQNIIAARNLSLLDKNYEVSFVSRDDPNFYRSNNLFENPNIGKKKLSKNEKNRNKKIYFDKIFFEQKKEEITPYKIIINDYVINKEYEVDNN